MLVDVLPCVWSGSPVSPEDLRKAEMELLRFLEGDSSGFDVIDCDAIQGFVSHGFWVSLSET